jgi:hypothetical protein
MQEQAATIVLTVTVVQVATIQVGVAVVAQKIRVTEIAIRAETHTEPTADLEL